MFCLNPWNPVQKVPSYTYVFYGTTMFSSLSFNALGFKKMSLSQFKGDGYRPKFILQDVDIQFSQDQFLKMLSFLHCVFLGSLSNIRCM